MISPFEIATPSDVMVLAFPEMESGAELLAKANEEQARRERELKDAEQEQRAREAQRLHELEQAHQNGFNEGLKEAEAKFRDALEIERSGLALSAAGFARARDRYFADVETEIVKLALAIAGRVLQREVSVDPIALAGVVRVALGKLGDTDGAVLYAAPVELERWRRALKNVNVRVEAGEALAPGDLQLKSNGGIADLGIEAQLAEIEHGFFDLLSKRPA